MLTDAELADVIKRAEQVVDRAGTAADLRGAALVAAVVVITSAAPSSVQPTVVPERARERPPVAVTAKPVVVTGSLGTAATALGVKSADLEVVVAVSTEGPFLLVPASLLPTGSTPAMRSLVLLLAAIRQAGRWDMAETDAAVLRESLLSTHRTKFDANNYTNALNGMDRQVSKRSASGKVMLRVLPAGFTAARNLIVAIVAPPKEPTK